MKRKWVLVLLAFAIMPVVGWAATRHADISGIDGCDGCHVPHGGISNTMSMPLWYDNAVDGAPYTGGNYSGYSSITMNAVPGAPLGISKLCLGCHDGTTRTGMDTAINTPIDDAALDLAHPVSFVFDGALLLLDDGLNDPTTDPVKKLLATNNGTTRTTVECSSCHDPHTDAEKYIRSEGIPSLTVLCRICHNK